MEKELITLVVMPRDHFSTTDFCIEQILQNTPEPFELWVLSGGAPDAARNRWEQRFGGRVSFTFFPDFKNGAELRNYALSKVMTRLAVFVDSDVYVRPGWLEGMMRCQRETGAAMITPIILDRDDRVHTAGNDFFVTEVNGARLAKMELRYQGHRLDGPTNLLRRETDFCEMHCQLVLVETARRGFDVFDPNLREFQEMDAGLTLTKHGLKMMFEPESVVYLFYEDRLKNAEDLALHMWKWDMDAMRFGFEYFRKKWEMDINPYGEFDSYLCAVNRRVGRFSRRWQSPLAVKLDKLKDRLSGFAKFSLVGP
jgi:glycosyltransferase involved in cell wall biosynthesis